MDSVLHALRQVKHRAFVMRKQLRRAERRRQILARDVAGRLREKRDAGPEYQPGRYSRTFLERPEPQHVQGAAVPRVIYTIWLGGELPARRRRSLERLRELNPELEVVLITEADVERHVLPEHPLHPAYRDLTAVHKSDYLRIYLMHFHGGGYSDLKMPSHGWAPAFDALAGDPSVNVVGYREVTSNYTSENPRALGEDLRKFYRFLVAPSAFVMRPGSLFTACMYRELLRRMDYCAPALTDSPVQDPYRLPDSYPVWWGELMGDLTQSLSLRYPEQVVFDDRIRPRLKDYR